MAERNLSQRHVCGLLGVDPKTVRRPERRGDEAVRARLRALAGERRRFGYRRLGILLEREGMVMNHKKLYRLYRAEALAVRRRRGRKRATGTRAPLALPQAPDQRWSLDFVSDCLAAARRFRILVVVDDFTRECLAAVADTSKICCSNVGSISVTRRCGSGGTGLVRCSPLRFASGGFKTDHTRTGVGTWTRSSCGSTARPTTSGEPLTTKVRCLRSSPRNVGIAGLLADGASGS
jgi:hypothetical protein